MWELFSVSALSVLSFMRDRGPVSRGVPSERQQNVHHLRAVARLLYVGELAAAAIGDAGLCDLAGIDGVVALDILWTDDAGHDQLAHFEIDANFLLAFDHHVAVRQ